MKRKQNTNFIRGLFAVAIILPVVGLAFFHQSPVRADSTNGKILYEGYRDLDGDDEIYVMDGDGANQTQITNNSVYDYDPAWSADGTKVVFTSDRDGDEEIFVMNLDGTNEVKLTNNTSDDSYAAWAPDNSKIVFTSNRDGDQEIYSMNIDGTGQTRLTNSAGDDYLPVWAPGSDRIAFVSDRHGFSEIYTMDPDGTNLTRLTTNTTPDTEPDWSPDGTKIAFEHNSGSDSNIHVMNADGTGNTAITSGNDNYSPSWSVDGTKIAFSSNRDTNGDEIYTINADGSGETQLTNIVPDFNYNMNPDWGGTDTTGGGGSGDADSDGSSDAVEATGPNGGDANNDGTADSAQASVTSMVSPITGNYVVLQSSCTSNSSMSVAPEPADYKDIAFDYPAGLVSLTLTCSTPGTTANVSLYFYGGVNGTAVRKYNSTTHTYQAISGASLANLTIAGQTVTRATYQITDGSSLDQDAAADGTIVDPVGIGQAVIGAPQTGLGGLLMR